MPNRPMIDPRTLPGFFAWYNANFVNGFTGANPADAATIAQWNDLGPGARHLLQATEANKPTFRKDLLGPGLHGVRFADATDVMSVAITGTMPRPVTVAAVFRNTLADNALFNEIVSFNARRIGLGIDWLTSNAFTILDDLAVGGNIVPGDTTIWHIGSFVASPLGRKSISGVDGFHSLSRDGVAGTNTNRNIDVNPDAGTCEVAELVVLNGDLNLSALANLERSMAAQWNLISRYQNQK